MPIIGRPKSLKQNNFSNISMRGREVDRGKKKINVDKGRFLNDIAGVNKKHKYVDGKAHNQLGKNEFLRLLTHQLANQDPLNPMDQKKFAADLAQFSSLEQLSNLNSKFDKMGKNVPTESKYFGASFLGKVVVTKGTTINYHGKGDRVEVPFNLPKDAKNLIVRIFDKKGQITKQLEFKDFLKGDHTISWDGKSTDGDYAAKGIYTIKVYGWDEAMTPFNGETKTKGVVTGVKFIGDDTVLELDRQKRVFLRDVESFGLAKGHRKIGRDGDVKNINNINKKKVIDNYNNVDKL